MSRPQEFPRGGKKRTGRRPTQSYIVLAYLIKGATMKQKSKGPWIGRTTGDIKRDLTTSQLAGIGAVAMAWNSVESFVDAALLSVLGIQARIGERVLARINAFDAKVELIKSAAVTRLGLSEEQCEDLLKSLDSAPANAKELKEYRDAVIHCQLIDVPKAQGLLIKRDARYDVLLAQEALEGLYDRLIWVRNELRAACLVLITLDEAVKADAQADLQTLLREPEVQARVSQVREHRSVRLSLPPLPKFPK